MQEQEIAIVNKIVEEAMLHGADSGGFYLSNEEELINALNRYLIFKKINDKYEIEENEKYIPQIVKRINF